MSLTLADESAIAAHIEHSAYLSPGELKSDEKLFSSGIIDSMSLIELISFTEKRFAIRVPAEDITLENWDSLISITTYINRVRAN